MYSYQNNIVRIFSAEVLKLILGETCIKATLKCKAVVSSQKSCIGLYLEQQSRTMHMSERVGHKFVGRGSTILHMHSWQAPLHLGSGKNLTTCFLQNGGNTQNSSRNHCQLQVDDHFPVWFYKEIYNA